MKQTLLILLSSLLLIAAGKDLRVLVMTPTPQMHCESCENKIKKNLRFESGVKKIETSVKDQTVTVTYDAVPAIPSRQLPSPCSSVPLLWVQRR